MIRLLATTLVTPLLLLALTSCGDDDPKPSFADPTSEPTTVTPTTPEPSNDVTSPSQPDAESAAQFIQRWQAAEFAMQNTGKVESYLRLTTNCASCDRLAQKVKVTYGSGGEIKVRPGVIRNLRELGSAGGFRTFTYELRQFPTTYRESASAREKRLPGGDERFEIDVRRVGTKWSVIRTAELIS